MMTPAGRSRQPFALLLASLVLGCATLASAQPTPQAATLRLSGAPIVLEYPEEWRDWAVSLAAYADVAAGDLTTLLGVPLPAGTIRWEPAASGPGSGADGVVEVSGGAAGAVVLLRTNVPLMLQDYGAAHALGYGRWLGAYAAARIAMGAPGGTAPWWTEGAALYLTDRLFREARSTTPVLYGIESNFVRAAQIRRPIDLAAAQLTDAARGKAYATFKLLEALYGPDVVTAAIARLVARPSTQLASIVDAIGRDRTPDPDAVLREWLEPTVSIDIGLERVSVRDGGERLEARVTRRSPFQLPVTVEVRGSDGQVISQVINAVEEETRFSIDLPMDPTVVIVDPAGLIPDTNRSNNRHGFGSAENVTRFFGFDRLFDVSELEMDGTVFLDPAEQRSEKFTLRATNLTDSRSGLGILVSAEWVDRPERIQRAYFVALGPSETRVIEETLAYPNRGAGKARIEARFWHAGSIDDLTAKLIAETPGSTSNYILVREPPEAPRRAHRGIYRVPPEIARSEGTVAQTPATAPVAAPAADPTDARPLDDAAAAPDEFAVELTSPRADTLPIGEVVLRATVRGAIEPERVEFWVNERRIGVVMSAPYSLPWAFPDSERAFVVRAVAVAGDRIAGDDVVVDGAAIAFGSTVNLVTVHATVRDAQGRLVRGLTAEDFAVIEDGREQEIVQFDFGEVPVSAAVLLDQSSSMIGSGIRAERAGAKRLIASLVSEVNRAMVLGFNDRVYLYSPYTGDTEVLNAALETVDPDGSTALFDTLAEAVRKVNRTRGKRALVVLSDGLDTKSLLDYEDVVEYLRQADVLVYTIGLQLMQDGTEYGDASGAVKRGVEQLRALAESTGGAAYFPLALTELEEIYGLIADELNSQYALSYYPSNQRYDGAWRQLRIAVPGRPAIFVQVRPGYYGVAPR